MQTRRSIFEGKMGGFTGILRTGWLLVAALLLGGAAWAATGNNPAWLLTFTVTDKGAHIIGNPAAPTKVVEFASYTCPHCAQFEAIEAPQLKSQYVAQGQVSFEIRNLVRDGMDLTAAMAARCGGKGRFFANHRHLLATQSEWADGDRLSEETVAKFDREDFLGFVQSAYTELGLDRIMAARGVTAAQAKICMADAAGMDQIFAMTDEAAALGINGTPTLLVNGQVVDAYDFATLKPHFSK